MKIGRFEIIYHKSEIVTSDFKTECGIWYYLPIKWAVIHYLRQGRKLQAVKLHYYRTNKVGLKESKMWVDKLQDKENLKIVIR
jgi:hypothetical protein